MLIYFTRCQCICKDHIVCHFRIVIIFIDTNMENRITFNQISREIHIFVKSNFNDSSIYDIQFIYIQHHFNRMIVSLIDFDVTHWLSKCNQFIRFRNSLTRIIHNWFLIHQIDIFHRHIKLMDVFPVKMSDRICIIDDFVFLIFCKYFKFVCLVFVPSRIFIVISRKF